MLDRRNRNESYPTEKWIIASNYLIGNCFQQKKNAPASSRKNNNRIQRKKSGSFAKQKNRGTRLG